MTAHVYESDLVASNAQRAYLIGYLLGITETLIACQPDTVAPSLRVRLQEIYPLIQKEFYPCTKSSSGSESGAPSPWPPSPSAQSST